MPRRIVFTDPVEAYVRARDREALGLLFDWSGGSG
jgi:hypothetical protein